METNKQEGENTAKEYLLYQRHSITLWNPGLYQQCQVSKYIKGELKPVKVFLVKGNPTEENLRGLAKLVSTEYPIETGDTVDSILDPISTGTVGKWGGHVISRIFDPDLQNFKRYLLENKEKRI